MDKLLISLIAIVFLLPLGGTIKVRKYVYQKDMSEYCKRRVAPSLFLGQQVVDAHSKILHFSKMELPYSCFISVRAESGSNVVLVVQLLSTKSLVSACAESPGQLLVYEMGETFGGYWGPLPDSVMHLDTTRKELYTRKTMKPETTELKHESHKKHTTKPRTTPLSTVMEKKEEDFIRIELPIVNVSGELIGDGQASVDNENIFDLLYDVTPRYKNHYRTSILPLVQFSISRQKGGRRDEGFRYNLELDYEGDDNNATDTGLTLLPYYVKTARRKIYRTNFYVNKLLNWRHTRTPRSTKNSRNYLWKKKHTITGSLTNQGSKLVDHYTLSNNDLKSPKTLSSHSWESIEEILRKMNKSMTHLDKEESENKNITLLLETISNRKHNRSVYLLSNWDSVVSQHLTPVNAVTKPFGFFTRKTSTLNYASKNMQQFIKSKKIPLLFDSTSKSTIKSQERSVESKVFTTILRVPVTRSDIMENNITETNEQNTDEVPLNTSSTIANRQQIQSNASITSTETSPHTNKLVTGPMVDHESWENVVQAAPVMAGLLNQAVTDAAVIYTANTTQNKKVANKKGDSGIRMKRRIKPIPIENARPHNLTTRELITTTTLTSFGISDIQELAQLVEFHDDELHERVALRYLGQYTGPQLFNICDFVEPNTRHVYLFNSSRVVLAIHNFTLDRMTVMLTSAHTLLGGMSQCAASSLECQVYGTRICIDSMNACDGVPNCGAYDIYDEDRLMCGASAGLRHNVYLAAVTFLAVLLTMIYIIHYWLRRCVPKVSKAFFIYTDTAENVLYLESIMRSPHDNYDMPKMTYHAQLFEDDDYLGDIGKTQQRNMFHRMKSACLNCCKCKRKRKNLSQDSVELGPHRMYSFAELELSKMMYQGNATDVAVQTGDSFDMILGQVKKIAPLQRKSLPVPSIDDNSRRLAHVVVSPEDDLKYVNELSMLKFFRELKSGNGKSASRATLTSGASEPVLVAKPSILEDDEKEFHTHFYDQNSQYSPGPSHREITTTCDIHSEKTETTVPVKKHLRFEEEPFTIPSAIEEDDDDDIESKESLERKADSLDATGSGRGRDFKRFWKGKKSKKKAHKVIKL